MTFIESDDPAVEPTAIQYSNVSVVNFTVAVVDSVRHDSRLDACWCSTPTKEEAEESALVTMVADSRKIC